MLQVHSPGRSYECASANRRGIRAVIVDKCHVRDDRRRLTDQSSDMKDKSSHICRGSMPLRYACAYKHTFCNAFI
jgi:hypothetical protein